MDTSNFMRIHHKTNKQIKYGTNELSFCITNPSVAEFAAHKEAYTCAYQQ